MSQLQKLEVLNDKYVKVRLQEEKEFTDSHK